MEHNWRNQRGRRAGECSPWQSNSRNRTNNETYSDSSSSQARFGNRNRPSGQNWECSSCRFSNFSTRTACFKCRTPKGESSSFAGEYITSWKNSGDDSSEELIDWESFQMDNIKYEAARMANLPPLEKNVYFEDPDVKAMSRDEVERFRQENFDMKVYVDRGSELQIPNPVQTFVQAFRSYPAILREIAQQGFEKPSPIQCQSWPILMQGLDMIGIAQTGTGKTLAFILPALLHIVAQPTPRNKRVGPTCLVLAPTRELAQQIEKEVSKYSYDNIKCVCVYGQGDKRIQVHKIRGKAEIVVATPGRLNDFTSTGIIDLSGVSYLVLDEADRMLDMGFEPQIRKAVLLTRPDRQTVMTSATWPEGVRDLASKLMKEPITVVVGSLDLKAVHTVTQKIMICDEDNKKEELIKFITGLGNKEKAIVFVGRKSMVDFLSVAMLEEGLNVCIMHGDICQHDREQALRDLKSGKSRVLIATDVASRGIDVNDVTHIFNFDCPRDMEEYVHRVGRTGRAGRSGSAITLFTRNDWARAEKLIDILERSNQDVPRALVRMMERWKEAQARRSQTPRTYRF
uniref:RNA helicase n=1 Tax=Scylla olivacea TaxID=85551 RepID=A0A0P4WJQ0_SCYOL